MPDATVEPGVVARIYGNLGRLAGGKAAAGVLSLAYMAVATRALGPADYGVLILAHTYVMTVGGIIEFPGWHAVVRYGAQAMAEEDRPRLTRLIAYAAVMELVAGIIAVGVAAALAPLVGAKLGWSAPAIAFAGPYSLAVLASIRATPAGYLQLMRRFDLLGAHAVAAPLVRLCGATIAAALHAGLKGFLIAWLVAALAEWATMWALGAWVARGRLAPGLTFEGFRRTPQENPGLWRFMLGANADVTIAELAGRLAPLGVGWILGPAAAGLYAVAQRATAVIAQPAQLLGQAAYAELARLAASGGGGRRIRKATAQAIGVALLAAIPVLLLIAIFGRRLAVLTAGEAFAAAGGVMLWLAVARALLLAAPPISAALTALGRPWVSALSNLVSGLGMLLLLPWMLGQWGLAGAGGQAVLHAVTGVAILAVGVWRATGGRGPAAAQAG